MATVAIKVEGMVCGGCVASISKALQARAGVSSVSASLDSGEVSIEFDADTIQLPELESAIEAAGFDVAAA